MINFAPRREPLKEGRSYHGGLPYPSHFKPRSRSRQPVLIVVGLICFCLLFYVVNGGFSVPMQSSPDRLSSLLDKSGATGQARVALSDDQTPHPPGHQHPNIPESPSDADSKPIKAPTAPAETKSGPSPVQKPVEPQGERLREDEGEETPSGRKGYDNTKSSVSSATTSWSQRPRFEKALSKVINMLP